MKRRPRGTSHKLTLRLPTEQYEKLLAVAERKHLDLSVLICLMLNGDLPVLPALLATEPRPTTV